MRPWRLSPHRTISTDSPLPLYRLDAATYSRLLDAGALDGLDVELLDGLLVNRHPRSSDPIHRIDVGTYERMVATGALEGLPIELLEGLLVEVSPQGEEHASAIVHLTHHLVTADGIGSGVQLPLEAELGCGARARPGAGRGGSVRVSRHPRTALLAVEVSVSIAQEGPRDEGRSLRMGTGMPIVLARRRAGRDGRGSHRARSKRLRPLRALRPRHQGPIARPRAWRTST